MMVWDDEKLGNYVQPHEVGIFMQRYGLKCVDEVMDRHVAEWLGLPIDEMTFVDESDPENSGSETNHQPCP